MDFFWWLLANIFLPILLPFAMLAPWKLVAGHSKVDEMTRSNTSWSAAVKDGQFCLTAIAISAASLYECLGLASPRPDWLPVVMVVQGFFCATSLVVYTFAMAFQVEVDASKKTLREWIAHYKFGALSLFICFWVGALSIIGHWAASP